MLRSQHLLYSLLCVNGHMPGAEFKHVLCSLMRSVRSSRGQFASFQCCAKLPHASCSFVLLKTHWSFQGPYAEIDLYPQCNYNYFCFFRLCIFTQPILICNCNWDGLFWLLVVIAEKPSMDTLCISVSFKKML